MYFSTQWLHQHLATISNEKERINETIRFIANAGDYLIDDCMTLLKETHVRTRETGYREAELTLDYYFIFLQGQKLIAEVHKSERERIEKALDDFPPSPMISLLHQMFGFDYWNAGRREPAFAHAYTGLKMMESFETEYFGWSYFQLGVFHYDLKDYDVAYDYFTRAVKHADSLHYDYAVARAQAGLAGVHLARGNSEEALRCINLALEGFRNCGHKTAESRALNDLGVICRKTGRTAEAEKFLREALALREELNFTQGIITTQMQLAELLMERGTSDEIENLLSNALQKSKQSGVKPKAAQAHKLLSEYYKKKGDAWKALEHIEQFFALTSLISGEESSNRIKNLQQKFATENADKEAEIHRLKNVELKEAYEAIEEKNKSIVDSINYAKRIQLALLPTEKYMEKNIARLKKTGAP